MAAVNLCVVLCIWLQLGLSDGKDKNGGSVSNPSQHPGHMKRFGSQPPHKTIETYKGFPSAERFFNDYVTPSSPVLMKKASFTLLPHFTEEAVLSDPHSITSFIPVRERGQQEERKMSVRQFLQRYESEDLFLDNSIPFLLKYEIPLPRPFQCKPAVDVFQSTRMVLRSGEWHDVLLTNKNNIMMCQVAGNIELRMINAANFPNKKEIMDRSNGTESGIDILKVDYQKYPALLNVPEYYVHTINTGDCVFIPANWLYQTSSTNKIVTISLLWSKKVIVPSENICGNTTGLNLATVVFKADPPPDILKVIRDEVLHSFLEDYVAPNVGATFSYDKFQEQIKKDEELKDLVEWNDECADICYELFQHFDVNKDGFLSMEDFDEVNEEDIEDLDGYLGDCFEGFRDIIQDQIAEKKVGSMFNIPDMLSVDFGKEMQDVFQEGFNEILKEANIQGEIKFDQNGKPIVNIEDKQKIETNGKVKPSEGVRVIEEADEEVEELNAEEEIERKDEL